MSQPPAPAEWLAHLIEQYQWSLFGFARGLLRDEEAARDVAQETFCDAWRTMGRGVAPFHAPLDEAGVRRWLFHVAYRRAISWARRNRRARWEPLDDAEAHAQVAPGFPFDELVVENDALQRALGQLVPHEVAVLLLNVVQGFSVSEIAVILDISLEAAKKRLSRAKGHLRAAYFADEPLAGGGAR